MSEVNYNKFANTVLYLLQRCEPARPGLMGLMKMLWFVDYLHYKKQLRLVTGGQYVALQNGPALAGYDALFDRLERDRVIKTEKVEVFNQPKPKQEFQRLMEPDVASFTDSEVAVLDEVISRCAGRTGKDLVDETHREGPWQMVWHEDRKGQPISPVLFRWLDNLPSESQLAKAKQALRRPHVEKDLERVLTT